MFQKDILDEIVSIQWLYEKIFGKDLLEKLVFNNNHENKKNILKNVYWFRDTDTIFPTQIERKEFKKLSEIIFRFNPEYGAKKDWFFTKKDS